MPTARTLDRIRARMRRHPAEHALYARGNWLTLGQLAQLTDALSISLRRDAALPEGCTVTVPVVKSAAGIALLIACWEAGYRTLLVSPGAGEIAIRELSDQAGSAATLTTTMRDGQEVVAVGPDRTAPAGPRVGRGAGSGGGARPGLLFTTSGSTGTPKVVACADDGIDGFIAWADREFGLGPGRVVLSYAPLNFDISLLDVWSPLSAGGGVVLVDADQATAGGQLADVISRTRCQVIQAVPLLFDLLVEAAGDGEFPAVDRVLLTGDVTPERVLKRLPGLFPGAAITNVYGCTETNDSFSHEVSRAAAAAGGPVPIGRPIAGTCALILDDSESAVANAGEGELLVSTPFQAAGYLDPDSTAAKWVTMPDGVRYFRTGDLVRRDAAGDTYLLGRKDSRIKVRGVTTDLLEVEQAILAHPGVADVAVIAVPGGEAGHELHAVIQPRAGAELSGLLLRRHCAARLPLTAVPTRIDLVDRLPRTATGKPDRTLLARQHQHQRPRRTGVESEVRDFILANFASDVAPADLDKDLDLIDNAVMNSLQVLRLIAWIGDHYNISLKDAEISPQNFRTVAAIASFINSLGPRTR